MAGLSLSEFFSAFLDPDPNEDWPEEYLTFINDLYRSFDAELFDSREQLYEETKRLFSENGNKVGEPARINVQYGARMIYMEISWIEIVLMRILDRIRGGITQLPGDATAVSGCWTWVKRAFILPILGRCQASLAEHTIDHRHSVRTGVASDSLPAPE